MATLTLPLAPSADYLSEEFVVRSSLSPADHRALEPVGPHFLAHARRKRHNRTFSEDERIQATKNVKKVEEEDSDEFSDDEDPMMLNRDAKDWKQQDHYAVLGLSKYRWRATDDQIKKAHRKKVLKHHPDKKAASGKTEDDSFFKCIQKAMEILTDPVKRRQWDSVDEAANVEPPTNKKANFYKHWGPVFESEGRFSKKQPVPKLGNEKSSREDVESFYNFFYNFDSWRTFEYLDEDVPDDNENRDQKRYVERKNKAQRAKRKTEDNARLRELVDVALGLDPRIKMFKQAEKAQKSAKRLAREAEEKKAAEEAAAKAEAEKKAKEEAEAAALAAKVDTKKAKEAAKNAAKKNKRVWKGVIKDVNYFVEGTPSASVVDTANIDIEHLIAKADPELLQSVATKLNEAKPKGATAVKEVYTEVVKDLVAKGSIKAADVKTFLV